MQTVARSGKLHGVSLNKNSSTRDLQPCNTPRILSNSSLNSCNNICAQSNRRQGVQSYRCSWVTEKKPQLFDCSAWAADFQCRQLSRSAVIYLLFYPHATTTCAQEVSKHYTVLYCTVLSAVGAAQFLTFNRCTVAAFAFLLTRHAITSRFPDTRTARGGKSQLAATARTDARA